MSTTTQLGYLNVGERYDEVQTVAVDPERSHQLDDLLKDKLGSLSTLKKRLSARLRELDVREDNYLDRWHHSNAGLCGPRLE